LITNEIYQQIRDIPTDKLVGLEKATCVVDGDLLRCTFIYTLSWRGGIVTKLGWTNTRL